MAESTADGDLPDSFGFSFESAAKLFCEREVSDAHCNVNPATALNLSGQ